MTYKLNDSELAAWQVCDKEGCGVNNKERESVEYEILRREAELIEIPYPIDASGELNRQESENI